MSATIESGGAPADTLSATEFELSRRKPTSAARTVPERPMQYVTDADVYLLGRAIASADHRWLGLTVNAGLGATDY